MKKRTMVPFVKWVGGKRQIIEHIEKVWPKNFNTYFEPFVGGGAVLFHFQPKKAVINDLNKELINLYKVISSKNSYKRLRELLLLMEAGHHVITAIDQGKSKYESPFYRKIARMDRVAYGEPRQLSLAGSTKELRAARFVFLNKNGFNGLYRVNSKGEYNVPSKHKPTKTFEEENIGIVSEYLRDSVEIYSMDFKRVLKNAKEGDFVYLDPPYDYEEGQKGFDAYQKEGFGSKGQVRLAKVCKELHKRGVKFLLSNHNTKLIQELYEIFEIKVIKANRLVGGKGSSRQPVEEVLVRNYA